MEEWAKKICKWCGKEFEPNTKKRVFCSTHCRRASEGQRARNESIAVNVLTRTGGEYAWLDKFKGRVGPGGKYRQGD